MKSLIISSALMLIALCVSAQNRVEISGGADLVSSYIWRGSYNAGASIQPSLAMNIRGFSLGAWGSTDIAGNDKKEVDLSLSYSVGGLRLAVTDYWWAGEGAFKYFRYSNKQTAHLFEAGVTYQLPFEKFPLTASWNTIFAGGDLDIDRSNNYSTYIELSYPLAVGSFELKPIIGFVPWSSPAFIAPSVDGFSVCNISILAQKDFQITDSFSLPMFTQLIFNPATEDIHLVFGLSLRL